MTEPTNADRAAHAAQALEAFLAADGREQLSDAGTMAALITGLVHYADRQGIEFGPVLAASNNSYMAQRGSEEHPYHLGQEIQIRDAATLGPPLASLPARGVVVAMYPGGIGPQMYAVRFPGEVNAMPFTGSEIEPAPPFQPVRTMQGVVSSLVEGEDLLVSTAVRIRLDELRKVKPGRADIKDRDLLATVLGELCQLTSEEMVRQVQIPVTALVEEGLARQAANALGREHAHAGITPFAVETERRLIAALQERGVTIPPDPAFERIMLVEYHSAFDHASELPGRNDAGTLASSDAAPQLAEHDFPRHSGDSHAIVSASADPAASSSPTRGAEPSAFIVRYASTTTRAALSMEKDTVTKWTPAEIRALGPTTDLLTLGAIFGCSRWKSYQMARQGEWERVGIKVIPIGSKYRVVVQSILDVLGYGFADLDAREGTDELLKASRNSDSLSEPPPGGAKR